MKQKQFPCPECGSTETGIVTNFDDPDLDILEMLNASITLNPLIRECEACEHKGDVLEFDVMASLEISDGFLLEVLTMPLGRLSWPLLMLVIRLGRQWYYLADDFRGYIPTLELALWLEQHADYLMAFLDLSPEEFGYAVEDMVGLGDTLLEYGLIPHEGQYAYDEPIGSGE